MNRNILTALVLGFVLGGSSEFSAAAGGEMHYLEAHSDLSDRVSLQLGAKYFTNYCIGCHSLSYMRYSSLGRDLGLTEEQVKKNFFVQGQKIGDKMTMAMRESDAKKWFGVAPPDLSVVARARGADWLYTYLVAFYRDDSPSRPFGVNNVVFNSVGMPHVLAPLQGVQEIVRADRPTGKIASERITRLETDGSDILLHTTVTLDDDHHTAHLVTDRLQVKQPGSMQPGQFREAARDLTNFLVYAGEPAKLVRYKLGVWVLLFLGVFVVITYLLYKEYWKDVH